jgi:hypothetical protein
LVESFEVGGDEDEEDGDEVREAWGEDADASPVG